MALQLLVLVPLRLLRLLPGRLLVRMARPVRLLPMLRQKGPVQGGSLQPGLLAPPLCPLVLRMVLRKPRLLLWHQLRQLLLMIMQLREMQLAPAPDTPDVPHAPKL
mgnify:CR=1 FL=1